MRYKIILSYNGTPFCGWQKQPNAKTIQGEIEIALNTLLQTNIDVVGCGRTDTGVHAKNYCAHFDTEKPINSSDLVYKLNKILAAEIAIHSIETAPEDFHSRFNAISRTYHYRIHQQKDAFLVNSSWLIGHELNISKMNEACKLLIGTMEFGAFCKGEPPNNNYNCKVIVARWVKTDSHIQFQITANRFLRNMVRAIVGTCLEVGTNKLSVAEFQKIIDSNSRSEAGISVPAHGLYLVDIKYP